MEAANATSDARTSVSTESIGTTNGLTVSVEKRFAHEKTELLLRVQTPKPCVLHWGIRPKGSSGWRRLPETAWPEGTIAAGTDAMQTPFRPHNGESRLAISLTRPEVEAIEFVLYFPDEKRWDNNSRRNYRIAVAPEPNPATSQSARLKAEIGTGELLFERTFDVESSGRLAAAVIKDGSQYRVLLLANIPSPLLLHWGIARRTPHEWLQPPESARPAGSMWSGQTPQTPFSLSDGLNRLSLSFEEPDVPLGLQFVLKQGADGKWLKNRGGNFYVPIQRSTVQARELPTPELAEMAARIVQAETGSGSWTLMHRFNLCFDLLDRATGNVEALALLYAWLRFSAIRQLTWQRNYNTKPRELAHAQDRLSNRLAELYSQDQAGRALIRLMLATIGQGGDGQRIRDEILQIMHRHHVKEVSGHFLEEWHQKLHNNTTPDDIVICQAYLDFLRSNGNLDTFYKTLQDGGVTRQRLESFERPIRTRPDFVPHLKDALAHEFENFLKVLKSVHSATDLETAIQAAKDRVDADTQGLLWHIWGHRHDPVQGLVTLMQHTTEVRRRVSKMLQTGERLLIYLDLALEQFVRMIVERNLHSHLDGKQLTELIALILENLTFVQPDAELQACSHHWARLAHKAGAEVSNPRWALHAKSIVDRLGRALSTWTDRVYRLLQPKAEFLGQAFGAESWTITLFSEEVVRGSSLGFALSMLLHQIARLLRQSANFGIWQIVSRGSGIGQVEVVDALRTVQRKKFSEPTVVIADKVMGDEEIPEQIVAVIAPDVTDLVSHVAVRARNTQVLFASCSDPNVLEQLKQYRGRRLRLEVTPAGDVTFAETSELDDSSATPRSSRGAALRLNRPRFTRFVVGLEEFNEKVVGGKSCSQARLRGKLPDWVHQPQSIALPFGVFEEALGDQLNTETARCYKELTRGLQENPSAESLAKVSETVIELNSPEPLKKALREEFGKASLPWPHDWEAAWRSIKQVWASKWNERAVLSRQKMGIQHEDLFMAVLIQPVIESEYAFVIHTINPSTGNSDELYAEIVLGLGETLVGNYPGRALSFVWDKKRGQARLASFPSKDVGLYGGGLIFRSDSNGEDLATFAGAGLYDSVLMNPPQEKVLDYSNEPLVWDEAFRTGLLTAVAKIGEAVEAALRTPQDIEGVVSRGQYYVVQSRAQVGVQR